MRYYLLFVILLYSSISYGQNATGIAIQDTRDINDLPSFNKKTMRLDLKKITTIGVPGTGTFSTNITISPWIDATGGLNHQLSFNDGGIFYRNGSASSQSWNNWQRILMENSDKKVQISDNALFGRALHDTFTHDNQKMGHYALRWGADSSVGVNPVFWLSSFGGIKFFTSGKNQMFISHNGNVGIGTSTPFSKLDVDGAIISNGLRIGKVDDPGNIKVSIGEKTIQYNIDFSGYRDMNKDQIGARISAIRYNKHADNAAYIQSTALTFSTNQLGGNAGDTDLQERMRITPNGNVGIGTDSPKNKLDVAGVIRAEEIKIEARPWADFVFNDNYKLRSLEEVKAHIEEHKHLPDMPSEATVKEEGTFNLGEMQVKLLQKIEELTLYVIEQNKMIKKQEQRIIELENKD